MTSKKGFHVILQMLGACHIEHLLFSRIQKYS